MAKGRRIGREAGGMSSSEEEEGSSEENEEQGESESDSEEDKVSTPLLKNLLAARKPEAGRAPAQPQPSSSDDSSSESDSPAGKTRLADSNLKPVASKPTEEPPKATKKPRSKTSLVNPAAKSTAVVKLPVEGENKSDRDSKKAKRKAADAAVGPEESTAKKQLFQRLWSEDDEIAILKGMIEFTSKNGIDPASDMHSFHDYIKKSLHTDVSKVQLSAKVRRLKKKYENRASKSQKGEDPTISKPHEQKAYELSKKIWSSEANGVGFNSPKANEKATKKRNKAFKLASPEVNGLASPDRAKEGTKMDVESNVLVSPSDLFNRSTLKSNLDDEIIKDGLELISGPKKVELQEKWKKLRVEELELYLKRVDLIREQTKLALEALKSSGH